MALHPQARALIDRWAELGARPLHELGVIGARAAVDGARVLAGDRERVASVREVLVPGPAGVLPVRVYDPEPGAGRPLVVYLHGGGFVAGSVDASDRPCRTLAVATRCVVASVEYRRSPETPFPGPLEDAYAATCALAGMRPELGVDPDRLVVAGDSAGGGLAAGVTLLARDRSGPRITGQVLVYPALAPAPGGVSDDPSDTAGAGGGLSRGEMDFFWRHYLPDPADPDPYAAPLHAADLSGLPAALVVTAEHDVLRAEGLAYASRLRSAGVPVTAVDAEGMMHGFVGQFGAVPAGRRILDDLAEFLR
ncbi:alpha/beta hydrolase [Pseudonocardia petroleophila]|uniref:Alpha/beta hydrolase n=1 Tax=Pseudonocardia petroleophila TaxID=37331 RepID=A0A7G7MDA8_9PSEU|nr:alpha/beta hydrolase [Pseudonocardia petroleophila]QNG50769.1 alpha/beta hydrolase [Pseudonocardia petroleophila]